MEDEPSVCPLVDVYPLLRLVDDPQPPDVHPVRQRTLRVTHEVPVTETPRGPVPVVLRRQLPRGERDGRTPVVDPNPDPRTDWPESSWEGGEPGVVVGQRGETSGVEGWVGPLGVGKRPLRCFLQGVHVSHLGSRTPDSMNGLSGPVSV